MLKLISRRKSIGLIAISPFAIAHCASFRSNHSEDPSFTILDVPAINNSDSKGCLPYSIKGICEYYGLEKSLKEINRGLNRRIGEVSYITDGVRLLSEFQLNVDFYYHKNSSINSNNIYGKEEGITKDQIPIKVRSHNKHLSLKTITSAVDEGNPSIIFVDAYSLKNKPKKGRFLGHYVTVTGYDNINIYLNDTSKMSKKRKLAAHLFEKARTNLPWEYGMVLSKLNT